MTEIRNSWDTVSTTYRTSRTYQQEAEREIEAESTTSAGSSSTTTRARACAREIAGDAVSKAAMLRGQYVDVCEYYARSFHRGIAPAIQREFATRIKDGMSADVLRAAIDETMQAPRPSWAYLRAILRNLDLDQVKTLTQWDERKRRFQSACNPALNYQQRNYTEDDYGEDFFINVVDLYPPYDEKEGQQ